MKLTDATREKLEAKFELANRLKNIDPERNKIFFALN